MAKAKTLPAKDERGRFVAGEANPGRQFGATARYTRVIKEALLIAAEEHGKNGHGKGKLIGFMHKVLEEDLKTFCMMMARAMTLQVETRTDDVPKDTVYATLDEVKREMASKGVSFDVMLRMVSTAEENMMNGGMMDSPMIIDNEGDDA